MAWLLVILTCSCWPPISAAASERFVDNENGTITDTETGLMWVSQDNGIPINWIDAVAYCKKLRTGGYADWRMPTVKELATLYNPNESNENGYHTVRLIITTAQSCWAVETRDALAGRFNFTYGKVYWIRKFYSGPTRVLAVRNFQ